MILLPCGKVWLKQVLPQFALRFDNCYFTYLRKMKALKINRFR